MELAVLLALAGSASYAVAAVTQQRAAARLPKGRAFDLAALVGLARRAGRLGGVGGGRRGVRPRAPAPGAWRLAAA